MKSHRLPRAARSIAVLCLAFAVALAAVISFSTRARARARIEPSRATMTKAIAASDVTRRGDVTRTKVSSQPIVLRDGATALFAYPPQAATASAPARAPLTVVYLHGIHGRPENGCPWLREGATEIGWLVCPAANSPLPNGTFSWGGSLGEQHAVVARAEHAAQANGASAVTANVIVGFSQGAYLAVDLVRARLGSYRGLVLIAADVEPTRAMLTAAGVDRIVLAAGDLDGSSGPLKRTAARLGREGMDVRFVSLGAIGHTYATPETTALRDAIVWAGGSS